MKLVSVIFRYLPRKYRDLLKDPWLYFLWSLFQNLKLAKRGKVSFFSQTGEDELILKWLPESYGLYIDIGAGQPVCGSNTYHFYKKGWEGICVDPITDNHRMLKFVRKRDSMIQCLVSTTKGKLSFFEFVPYEYSTTVPTIAEELKVTKGVRFKHVRQLEVLPLSEFAPAMDPRLPTLFSIDVEGADLDVLKSNDWTKTLPRVICVEELDSTLVGNKSPIRNFLENLNYSFVDRTLFSSIFVHSDYLNSID
jgi:FkbM family methyltransferase